MEGEEEKKNNVSGNGFGSLTQTHSVRIYIYIFLLLDMLRLVFLHSWPVLSKSFLLSWGYFGIISPQKIPPLHYLYTSDRGTSTERPARESSAMVATPAKAAAAVYPAETVTKTMAVSVARIKGETRDARFRASQKAQEWV